MRMKIEVNVSKGYFVAIIASLVVLAGVIGVVAFGTSNPNNFGHTETEIDAWHTITTDGLGGGAFDTAQFDDECEYRVKDVCSGPGVLPTVSCSGWIYPSVVGSSSLIVEVSTGLYTVPAQFGGGLKYVLGRIPANEKRYIDSVEDGDVDQIIPYGVADSDAIVVNDIEKRCFK